MFAEISGRIRDQPLVKQEQVWPRGSLSEPR